MIGGWGEGNYRRAGISFLSAGICADESACSSHVTMRVTCRARAAQLYRTLESSMLWKRVQKRIEALAEASVAVALGYSQLR